MFTKQQMLRVGRNHGRRPYPHREWKTQGGMIPFKNQTKAEAGLGQKVKEAEGIRAPQAVL